MRPVLILGGYGNFGKRIAAALTKDEIPVVIAGRNKLKADKLQRELPRGLADVAVFDAYVELAIYLKRLGPAVVVNTCGPFQNGDYAIAETCAKHGVHYVDLADGREFVTGISRLDDLARETGTIIISGASTVPGLSSAVAEQFAAEFSQIDDMKYGISPGQKAERGLATTQGILSYVGKPLAPSQANRKVVYGWQNIYRQNFPHLGKRWMANCDIPDLDLFPEHYGIKAIRFSAGLELSFLHLGLWGMSWLVRLGLPLNLQRFAEPMLSISNWFDRFGTDDGGMFVILSGKDNEGRPHTRKWFIIARDGHGPFIPTVPAILLAKDLARNRTIKPGAFPCIGMVTLAKYLDELKEYSIVSVISD